MPGIGPREFNFLFDTGAGQAAHPVRWECLICCLAGAKWVASGQYWSGKQLFFVVSCWIRRAGIGEVDK